MNVTKDNFFAEENLSAALLMSDRSEEAYAPEECRADQAFGSGGPSESGADLALNSHPQDAISEYERAISLEPDPKMLVVAYQTLWEVVRRTRKLLQGAKAISRRCESTLAS